MISTIPTRINLSLFRSAKISSEAVNFSQAMTCNSHITFTYEKRKINHHSSSSTFNLRVLYMHKVINEKIPETIKI